MKTHEYFELIFLAWCTELCKTSYVLLTRSDEASAITEAKKIQCSNLNCLYKLPENVNGDAEIPTMKITIISSSLISNKRINTLVCVCRGDRDSAFFSESSNPCFMERNTTLNTWN